MLPNPPISSDFKFRDSLPFHILLSTKQPDLTTKIFSVLSFVENIDLVLSGFPNNSQYKT